MNQELKEELERLSGWDIPKCDVLEFLLEKLPYKVNTYGRHLEMYKNKAHFTARMDKFIFRESSMEEAMLKLSLELFKEGILTK